MSIKDLREDEDFFFQENKKEVIIESKGKTLTFYANAISFFENQNIGIQARVAGRNSLSMLVAESITDEEGNKFTYDEVVRLKEEFAKPFLDAALSVNSKGMEEKK